VVAPAVDGHRVEADRHEQAAAALDRKITGRDRDQLAAIGANQRAAIQRAQQVTAVRAEQAVAARDQDLRARLVEAMTPDEIVACDQARTAWRSEQEQVRHPERVSVAAMSRDPIERARQTVAARRARDATAARQLGVAWDPDATGPAKARQTMALQQAARARDLAQQRTRGPSHDRGIEM
jgi:hypothetical protein